MPIKSVCVYCSSSNHVAETYMNVARDIGAFIAQSDLNLIYGGGHVGLMGTIADAALSNGGKVIGIIPEHIREREAQHASLTELYVVDSMHTRKSMMAEKADAFIALPGGFGTMEELFEVMTWKQLGLHSKPIVLYNINGFWDPLLILINHLIDGKFAPANNKNIFTVATNHEELLDGLFNGVEVVFNPEEKWQ